MTSPEPKPHMLDIDQVTRLKKIVSGKVSPEALPRVLEYLAAPGGEIQYQISGALETDPMGRQIRRLRCIISGWFFLVDSHSMEASRFDLDIDSTLRLVADESELPPLEAEADDEDVIVAGKYMGLNERLEEEILLALPVTAVVPSANPRDTAASTGKRGSQSEELSSSRISPFAKLASLKKH